MLSPPARAKRGFPVKTLRKSRVSRGESRVEQFHALVLPAEPSHQSNVVVLSDAAPTLPHLVCVSLCCVQCSFRPVVARAHVLNH